MIIFLSHNLTSFQDHITIMIIFLSHNLTSFQDHITIMIILLSHSWERIVFCWIIDFLENFDNNIFNAFCLLNNITYL